MARLVALYKHPQNPAAFDDYYYTHHVPLAKTIAGLRKYEINAGRVSTVAGETTYHLVATLTFDSVDAIQKALVSPEGKAAAADLVNFADAGVELLVFDTREV